MGELDAIIAVNGPGSFTGVRVGLSAVKGLAKGAGIPVVAFSRLEVLSRKSGVPSAALDAHRGEVFLRLERMGSTRSSFSPAPRNLPRFDPAPMRVAVCDEGAAALLAAAWPQTQLVPRHRRWPRTRFASARRALLPARSVDLALLDGHYLRRSDAEIFGADVAAQAAAARSKDA